MAVVVRVGVPLTTLLVSPFTKPVIVAVRAGFAAPAMRLFTSAVTAKAARFTVTDAVLLSG